jgi:N-methylhydantoinase A
VLGRIRPEHFLGGKLLIDPARSRAAVELLARSMSTDVHTAAIGILRVADATMARAVEAVSAARGRDPRD